MDDNYSEEIRENSLFHYTDTKGLIGILTTGKIWATAPHCTNDLLEHKIGPELLKDKIYGLVKEHGPSNYEKKMISDSLDKKTNEALSGVNFFITSFSIAPDEKSYKNGQLSQWRSYGNKGYAIVLDKIRLIAELKNRTINGVLRSVSYAENKNEHLDYLLKKYTEEVINSFINVKSKKGALFIGTHREEFEQLHNDFIESLTLIDEDGLTDKYLAFLNLMTLSKNKYFEEENEHRLSYFLGGVTEIINLFEKNGLLVPYIKLRNLNFLDYVTKIIIGPSARMNDKKKSIELFLKSLKKEKEEKIKIYESKIPYSGS